ncbi:MAG: translesion DNA synthesis-associated protein ImuA [Pseudomonadota bacterium]
MPADGLSPPPNADALTCGDEVANLLADTRIWRGRQTQAPHRLSTLPTGWCALDERLPGGGWPVGALTEVLVSRTGLGELTLLLPALAQLTDAKRENAWIAWVAPPHVPYAPALAAAGISLERVLVVEVEATAQGDKQALWAAEQTLRSGLCAAVLGWFSRVDDRGLRRLQLAAQEGRAWGVAFRDQRHRSTPSPAALRLAVDPTPFSCAGIDVDIVKCRGTRPGRVRCPYPT